MIRMLLKKIVFAFTVIYGINIVLKGINIIIPINIYTLTITTILGIPGLLSLFVIFYCL